MCTVLISDLHLHAGAPDTQHLAVRFLEQGISGASSLYILGDLFDAWIGDDDPVDWATPFISALHQVSTKGTAVHLMHGNRDFLLGERFAERVGARLHRSDSEVIEQNGVRALLMHGDTLCTDDTDYQTVRATVREPAWQSTFLSAPLETRHERAAALRNESRRKTAEKDLATTDANPDTCLSVVARHHADILIHGHTHRPAVHRCGDGQRVVLGEWLPQGAVYGVLDHDGAHLKNWPS